MDTGISAYTYLLLHRVLRFCRSCYPHLRQLARDHRRRCPYPSHHFRRDDDMQNSGGTWMQCVDGRRAWEVWEAWSLSSPSSCSGCYCFCRDSQANDDGKECMDLDTGMHTHQGATRWTNTCLHQAYWQLSTEARFGGR